METVAQRAGKKSFIQGHEAQGSWSTALFIHQVAFTLGPGSQNDIVSTFWQTTITTQLSS